MKFPSVLLLLMNLVFISHTGFSQRIESYKDSTEVSKLIKPFESKGLFSGVVLIAEGDEIQYHKAFGYADRENEVLNTVNTGFGIGSITKAFTEVVVERLLAEGKLDLEDPVEKYISGFPKGPNNGIPKITHLYNHRAGVPHRVTSIEEETTSLTAEDIVTKVKATGLLFEPGERRLYSSAGYSVLARIIEIIEGKPFDHILEEQVLLPAQMESTYSNSEEGSLKSANSYYLSTHEDSLIMVKAPDKNLGFLTGAGSVFSTTMDLFLFRTAYEKGVFGKKLWKQTINTKSKRWTGWSGRTNGYWSFLDILPANNLTLIILTNVGSAPTWKIRAELQNLLLEQGVNEIELPPGIVPAFESLESLVGKYDNNGRSAVISFNNGRLYRGENEIYPISENRYYTIGSGSMVKFRRDVSGKVDALIQIRGDNEIVFLKVD